MADLWLEKELARQLAPVSAPESLWDRINQPRRAPRGIPLDRAFWPVAVVMLLLAVAGVVRSIGIDRDPDTLTDQELALAVSGEGASGAFDFRSDSFEVTRKWVKAEANIDIDLPAGQRVADSALHPERFVRLLGVRMTRLRGLPVAAIDYRVGDQVATLFVSGKHAGPAGNGAASRHVFSPTKSAGDTRLYSWNMHNQTYAIAFSGVENSRAACLLCHSNTPS